MQSFPDSRGHFGEYGGRYVAETLMPALLELEKAYKNARRDPKFRDELKRYSREYVGRPTPLYETRNLAGAQHRTGAKLGRCECVVCRKPPPVRRLRKSDHRRGLPERECEVVTF